MEKDIPLKTTLEVARQKRACRAAQAILAGLAQHVKAGISTKELDDICNVLMGQNSARPALKGYRGYPFSTCTSVNNVAAHGLPGAYRLCDGDIITLDLTAEVDGWYGDCAWTFSIGRSDGESRRLLHAAWMTTREAIKATKAGIRMGDIGHAIAATADRFGCRVLDSFVGHGIGRSMHEEPMVLNSGEPGTGLPIVPGMVFTIEPIVCVGEPEVQLLSDGWTVVTKDSSRCAQFEHTIAIFSDNTAVLTDPTGTETLNLDFPPAI